MPIFKPVAPRHERAFCVSNQITLVEDEDDEDDDYAGDDYDLLGEDEWEDNPAAQKLYAEMPKGWVMVKCVNFTFRSMKEMETWLKAECRARFKQVGFRSGCSYNVAVQFEDIVDATMFKLRWR